MNCGINCGGYPKVDRETCYLESTVTLSARQGIDMNVVIDPIWPWSYLPPFIASATGDVVAAVALSGLMALLLPILWQMRPGGVSARQLVRVGGALFAMALG